MKPVHDPLEYRSFTYPFLGEDTGIFGITGFNIPETAGDSIFLPENDLFLDGGFVGGPLTQPDVFVSGNTDSFNFSGNDSGTVVIFG